MARSGCTNPQYRPARRRYSNIITVVDVLRRYFHRALDCRADPDARTARIRAPDEKADLFYASGAVRFGARGCLLVGCALGRAAPCRRPNYQTAGAAAAALSFRAHRAGHLGSHRLSDFRGAIDT